MMFSAFVLGLFCVTTVPSARAQNGPFTADQLRQHFAKQYARDFADEFNTFTANGDFKDIYQYFLPRHQRGRFFGKFKIDRVEADGPNLILKTAGQAPLKIQVVDLLGERFSINGQSYTHDWGGEPATQREVLRRMFKADQARADGFDLFDRILDLGLPRAHAFAPLVPIVVQACVEGGCALAWFVAQRGAVWALSNSARITAAGVSSSPVVRKALGEALVRAAGGAKKMGEYIWMDLRTDPELANLAKGAKAFAVSPAAWIKAPFKAAGFLVAQVMKPVSGSITGVAAGVGMLTVNKMVEDGAKKNLDWSTSLRCSLSLQPIDSCSYAKTKVTVADAPARLNGAAMQDFWCPTSTVNEFQITTIQEDGSKLTRIWRVASAGAPDSKGEPIMGMRYEVDTNGKVRPNSARYYKFKKSKVESVSSLEFGRVDPSAIATKRKHLPDAKAEEADLGEQITRRDVLLKDVVEMAQTQPILTGNDIKTYAVDPLKKASDQEALRRDQEVAHAEDMESGLKPAAKICDDLPTGPAPAATLAPLSDAGAKSAN